VFGATILETGTPRVVEKMAGNQIQKLIEKEEAAKANLKELRQDLKDALESSDIYKAVLETTLGGEYQVTEKAAKTHALKVARDSFTPPKAEN
jgi:hypothetical protein